MKHITRMIIALLLLAMVLPMAVSCANTDQPSETTLPPETAAPSGSDISDTVAEDTLFALSEIPDDLRFDGQTIKILYWDDVPNVEFFVEDQTGEAVNDAIYRRNLNVQSQFGVNLEYTGTVGNYNNQSSFVNACINSTQSGADAYDIFCGYTMTGATLMTQGIAQDLTNYDIMEFDKPWWPSSLISKATVNGGIYFASGDISTNFIHMMYLTIFNKDMLMDIHKMNADELYDLAYDGKWTLDKFIELCTGVFLEMDGDNVAGEGDRYGAVVTNVHFDPFYAGSNLNTIEINENGEFALSSDLFSQKTVDLSKSFATFSTFPATLISKRASRSLLRVRLSSLLTVRTLLQGALPLPISLSVSFPSRSMIPIRKNTVPVSDSDIPCMCFPPLLRAQKLLRLLLSFWHIRAISTYLPLFSRNR